MLNPWYSHQGPDSGTGVDLEVRVAGGEEEEDWDKLGEAGGGRMII